MRVRIVHKISAISATGVLGLLIIAGIYALGLTTQQHYTGVASDAQAVADAANKVHIELLESRRAEKDFLLRNDLKYATRHAELARAVDTDLDALAKHVDADGQRDLRQKVDLIHDGFKKYAANFAAIVEAKRTLGLNENSGIEGALRGSVHDIEAKLDGFKEPSLLVTMLMMRRHEKDFMLRRDVKYGGDIKKRAAEFIAGLAVAAIPEADKADLTTKLAAYQRDFFAWMDGAVALAKAQEATSAAYAAIEPVIDECLKSVEQLSAAATASSNASVSATTLRIQIAILIVIIAVTALGFLIGRAVSRPLTAITTAMGRLADGDAGTRSAPWRRRWSNSR
jgi:methyl-accepting chemotaxis protein